MAAKEGRDDLVGLLLSFQADIDGRDADGKTAVHWASEEGHRNSVQVLVQLGADVALTDKVSGKHEVDAIARRLERRAHVHV